MDDHTQSSSDTDETPTVYRLYSPITLEAGSTITIECDTPIEVRDANLKSATTISTSGPLSLSVTVRTHLQPAGPYGPAFVRGWNKLALELKYLILKSNLVSARAVTSHCVQYWDTSEYQKYLRTTPELAALARQVFHESNTFVLHVLKRPVSRPHPSVRPFIRRVELDIPLAGAQWQMLANSAPNGFGFPNLQSVSVHFRFSMFANRTREARRAMKSIASTNPVSFPCVGKVRFELSDPPDTRYDPFHRGSNNSESEPVPGSVKRFQDKIASYISFA